MKKIILSGLMSVLAFGDVAIEGFLYKDPRVMGMGGANTALGGYSTALFYNPAGLINIKKSHGFEVELLGLSVAGSRNIQNLMNDIKNANNENDTINAVSKYAGEGFNANISNYSSVSYHTQSDNAFSIGLLESADINMLPHPNDGNNGLIETHSRVYAGITLGYATTLNTSAGKFTIGVDGKFITQKSYDVGLGAGEIANNNNNLGDYIKNNYEQTNSGFGVDVGVLYALPVLSSWNPTIGASIMNIGTLDFKDAYGSQPMTVNLGFSMTKELPVFNRIRVAVDYVDILNAQQTLVGDVSDVNGQYKSYKYIDSSFDIKKHIRGGVALDLIDNSIFMATLSGGWYQGAYTLGADLQLTVLKLQAATYQESLGSTSGEGKITDRRYVVMLGIGW